MSGALTIGRICSLKALSVQVQCPTRLLPALICTILSPHATGELQMRERKGPGIEKSTLCAENNLHDLSYMHVQEGPPPHMHTDVV